MSSNLNVLLLPRKLHASREPDLLLHKIDISNHFGYWVLYLQSGIHLDEIELLRLKIRKKLNGPKT